MIIFSIFSVVAAALVRWVYLAVIFSILAGAQGVRNSSAMLYNDPQVHIIAVSS